MASRCNCCHVDEGALLHQVEFHQRLGSYAIGYLCASLAREDLEGARGVLGRLERTLMLRDAGLSAAELEATRMMTNSLRRSLEFWERADALPTPA